MADRYRYTKLSTAVNERNVYMVVRTSDETVLGVVEGKEVERYGARHTETWWRARRKNEDWPEHFTYPRRGDAAITLDPDRLEGLAVPEDPLEGLPGH